MEDQALQHILNVQTQMLQHITNLQQQQSRNELNNPTPTISGQLDPNLQGGMTAFGTPLPGSIASPVVPPSLDPMVAPGTLSMSVGDPTRYGTYAAPYLGNGRPIAAALQADAESLISSSISQLRDFDKTRSSKEATDRFIFEQTRGFQERAAEVTGGVVQGATSAATFFVPGGVLPSLAIGAGTAMGVSGVANAIGDGARTSLDYQDILQRQSYRFLNAFESTNDLGGIGMGLQDRQELSNYLRDLAPEKFLQDNDMKQILEGATENNLLKSVSDVKSFKDKFSQVVDAVKEITLTMNQSIDEATKFMGEMESMGISTKDMPYISARMKTMSSMLGISATEGAATVINATSGITGNTAIDSANTMQNVQDSITIAQLVQEEAQNNNPELYDFIKNSGGAKSVGAQYQQNAISYINSEKGRSELLGFFGSGFSYNSETGEFEINSTMEDLLNGNYKIDEMRQMSQGAMSALSPEQMHRLMGTAGTLFSNYASENNGIGRYLEETANFLVEQQAKNGRKIDIDTALVEMGIASDYEQAQAWMEIMEKSTDPNVANTLDAKALKEEMDSHMISNNPGIKKQAEFWWERNITNTFGDIGQGVSDKTGEILLEGEKFLNGIDDRSSVNAAHLYEFNREGLEKMLGDMGNFNESSSAVAEKYGYDADIYKGQTDVDRMTGQLGIGADDDFSTEAFKTYLSQAKKDQLSAVDIAMLDNKGKELGFYGGIRAEFVRDQAMGKYDGILGKVQYGVDRTAVAMWNGVEIAYDNTIGKAIDAGKGDTSQFEEDGTGTNTYKSIEKQKDKIVSEKEKLVDETMTLFGSGDLGKNEATLKKIEDAIEDGDVAAVKALTKNKEATALADRYKTLQTLESDYGEGAKKFNELTKYTKALTGSGTQLGDLLNASGVYTESEIDDLLGDLRDIGKDTQKGIKKKKLSSEEMILANRGAINEIDSIFASMPEYNLHELAVYLDGKYQSKTMEDFYEKGTQNVDADKVKDFILNDVIRQSNLNGKEDSDGKKSNSKDSKKVAQEHEEAMESFLVAFQNEAAMLRDATAGVPVTGTNKTSMGTG